MALAVLAGSFQKFLRKFQRNEVSCDSRENNVGINRTNGRSSCFQMLAGSLNFGLKLNEWRIRRNEVWVHLEESSRPCLPLSLFALLFLLRRRSSRIVTPRGMFPRRTNVFWVFTSVVDDYDTYALALKALSCPSSHPGSLG